ncbi:hypothetical protein FOMPIDRAFT_88996 [Fomitopsis schrenkii]|uniref:Uncharacterized protein n=1 Tax=Fomitopsis schrenkii TaxID=2126942 RepID=S8EGJ1_FOMSC|nr:hypothetical protein FOMPIDRAFT_88996 [Fomitopsis schrenkii]
MGLFGGSKSSEAASENPEIRQVEQMVATEAKNEQKNLDHTLKDFAKLNGTHEKAIKAADKAQRSLDKAVKNENKTAKELNEAEHRHDNALSDQRNAYKTLELKRQQGGRIEQDLQQRKASVGELQQKKAANDAARESKLSDVHRHAAERARTRSVDFPNGPETDGGRTSVDGPIGEHDLSDAGAQGAGTGTTGVDANGIAISAGDRV